MNTWPKKDRIFQRLYRFWSMSTSKLSKLKTTEAYKYQRLLLLLTRRRPQRRDHKQKCKSQEIKGDTLWRCWNHSTQPHLLWITEWHQQWHSSSLVIFLLSSPGYILAISIQKTHSLLTCLWFPSFCLSHQHSSTASPTQVPVTTDKRLNEDDNVLLFCATYRRIDSALCPLWLWLVYGCVHGYK